MSLKNRLFPLPKRVPYGPFVLLFYCCPNKLTQTQWFKTTSINYLTLLYVRSPGGYGWALCSRSHKAEIKMLPRSNSYLEVSIKTYFQLLDLTREFGKTAGYKVNIQKLKAFLYTNNEIAETKIRGKIPFTIATRKRKYL